MSILKEIFNEAITYRAKRYKSFGRINPAVFGWGKVPFLVLVFWGMLMVSGMAYEWQEEGNLFWPAPPAQAHIYFIKSLSTSSQLNQHKTLWQKMEKFLFDNEEHYAIKPSGIAVDKKGDLYFTDPQAGAVYIYSSVRQRLKQITSIEKMALISPVGIAVSETGIMFVSDSFLNQVFAVYPNGQVQFILGKNQGLLRPTGLFIKNQKLYVVDSQACKVSVFDMKGGSLFHFGRKGQEQGEFNAPTYIFVDDQERIYVSDTLNFRIQIFDPQGQYLNSLGKVGDSSGSFSRPKGVALDTRGHMYITDALFDNVQIFDSKGTFLLSFGEAGSMEGQFWLPSGIAIDANNYIYIADTYNQRISIYQYRN